MPKPFRKAAILFALLVLGGGWAGTGMAENELPEKKLEALKARIGELEARIQEETRARKRQLAGLRDAEKSVAAAARDLEETRRAREAGARRLGELSDRQRILETEVARDREALAAETRAAWLAGSQPRLRLALTQQDPASLGRMLAWYGYLSRDRAGRIAAARDRLAELVDVRSKVAAETAGLARLETRQAEELGRVQAAREERALAVAALEASLAETGTQVESLKGEAAVLEKLVEELRRAVFDLPVPDAGPFADQRGRLSWPADGGLARDFGERRGQGPRSTGVLIAVPRGTEVRAVWTGRVAYADWLPGLGLLLILDHGDGYMSLYGHNEVLFRTVGDWVRAGEVVARAGDTGGRDQAALYFEIRKGKAPENPHRWFATRLSRAR